MVESWWPVAAAQEPPLIAKTQDTPTLVGLPLGERRYIADTTLRDSLCVPNPSLVAEKRILVFDDVFTDG